jgi:hypothetical protein
MACETIDYKQLMKKASKQKKPKSRKKLRYSKRNPENMAKNAKIPKNILDLDFCDAIIRTPEGLRTYDPDNPKFNGLHSYYHELEKYEWAGLLTLKFHTSSFSMDDSKGEGRKNRVRFLEKFMDNLRGRKFGISDSEFNWFACEEFGFFGGGHLHVIFSFDYLKEKERMDKLKISDFSEKGQFFAQGRESSQHVCPKFELNPRTVDFHWSPMWENTGLVRYFCKREFGREDKFFIFSKFWVKKGLLKAA